MKFKLATLLLIGLLLSPLANADNLNVESSTGRKTTINTDNYDAVIAIATWCPYSRALVKSLNDPQMRPYVRNKKLLFILDNEWGDMKHKLHKKYAYSDAESKLSILKTLSGDPVLAFPSVIKQLPGTYAYLLPPQNNQHHSVGIKYFPSIYDDRTHSFDIDHKHWLKQDLGIPTSLVDNTLYKCAH